MQRQCAWCLCFMDHLGEPVSAPQPKRYEVSHGMCSVCGSLWLEQVINSSDECVVKKTNFLPREALMKQNS